MGFGVMFVGFLFLFSSPLHEVSAAGIDILPDFIGYALIFYACRRLDPYGKLFRLSSWLLCPLFLLSVSGTVFGIVGYLGHVWADNVFEIVRFAEAALLTALLVILMLALSGIAGDVGKKALSLRAKIAAAASGIYYAAIVLIMAFLPETGSETADKLILIGNYGLWIIIFIFDAVQIFGCYMWICYEGDEDMPCAPSKLNDMTEKLFSHDKNKKR